MSFHRPLFNTLGLFGDYLYEGDLSSRKIAPGPFTGQLRLWKNMMEERGSIYDGAKIPTINYMGSSGLKVIKQNGHLKTVAFSPKTLAPYFNQFGNPVQSYKATREYLENSNLPEEMAWFYVESIIMDGEPAGPHYLKSRGDDDVTSAPLMLVNKNNVGGPWSGPKATTKGLGVTPNDKDITTIVDGKPITRKGLDIAYGFNNAAWLMRSGPSYNPGTANNAFLDFWGAGVTRAFGYYPPFLDAYSRHAAEFYYREDNHERFAYTDNLPERRFVEFSKLTTAHTILNVSLLNRPISTYDYLTTDITKTMGTFNQEILEGEIPHNINTLKWNPNRYGGNPNELGIGVNVGDIPAAHKYAFMYPDESTPTAIREEEEFQIRHENKMKFIMRQKGLSLFMSLAALMNPITYAGAALQLFKSHRRNILAAYVDERARKADAENNFNAEPQFFIGGKIYLPTSETITVSMPTQKVYYTKDGTKCEEVDAFEELPVNQLFKSIYEFEQYLTQFKMIDTTIRFKIQPFMQVDEYEPRFQMWAREPKGE